MSGILDEAIERVLGKAKEVSQFMLQLLKEKDFADQLKATVLPSTAMETERVRGVVPRPIGGIIKKGSITTTSTYQTVVSHVPTGTKKFQLTKTLISCNQDVMSKLRWNGTDVSVEVIIPANTPFTDWFPWDYYAMDGDGSKKVEIQVKYPTGGEAGTCYAELNGEEVAG